MKNTPTRQQKATTWFLHSSQQDNLSASTNQFYKHKALLYEKEYAHLIIKTCTYICVFVYIANCLLTGNHLVEHENFMNN